MMRIKMIGIDHTKAPLDVRQRFSFTKNAMGEAYEWLREQKDIAGGILLSTCNRMELWLSCREGFSGSVQEMLCRLKGVEPEVYRDYFIYRENAQAVNHLFELASGLKSQILGEDQILTQVGEAAAFSREHYCTDPILEALFRMAVTAGKKVKTQVPIQKADFSAAHRALEILEEQGCAVKDKTCLVIGNGEMGRITATALREAGARVTVTVRQYHSGTLQIPEGCRRINYGERYDFILQCDMVFSATASPNYTLTRERIMEILRGEAEDAGRRRLLFGEEKSVFGGRERVLVDLAVPRDIESAIGALPGIRLYDIDSFQLDGRSERMQQQIRKAEKMIREEEERFFSWYTGRGLLPRVQALSSRAAEDAVWRAGREVKKLGLTREGQRELEHGIEEATAKVIDKLLFTLRDSLEAENFQECLDALERAYPGEEVQE